MFTGNRLFLVILTLTACASSFDGVLANDDTDSAQIEFDSSSFDVTSSSSSSPPPSSCPVNASQPLVMGYFPSWGDLPPESISFDHFDWIDFAFAVPTENGDFVLGDSEPLLRRLVTSARSQSLTKIKLSVGGWDGSKYFSKAVATEESRAGFAANINRIYRLFGLDGIDVDWEYPGGEGVAGNDVDAKDTDRFLLFLRDLRSVLPVGACITAAGPIVPFNDRSGKPSRDLSRFASALDWLLMMNYDIWGSSANPGPNAPLYDGCKNSSQPEGNAVAAFNRWTAAGFPASKLVLGAPAYGYVSTSTATTLQQREESVNKKAGVRVVGSSGGGDAGQVTFRELVRQGALVGSDGKFKGGGGFERHWDGCSLTPYLRSERVEQVVSYDDTESLMAKAKFAKGVGMLGVNMFDLTGDTEGWDLAECLKRGLQSV